MNPSDILLPPSIKIFVRTMSHDDTKLELTNKMTDAVAQPEVIAPL